MLAIDPVLLPRQVHKSIMLTQMGGDDQANVAVDERGAELRRVLNVGDNGTVSSSPTNILREQRDRIVALAESYIDLFAFSLKDLRQTPTIEHKIPLVAGAIPTPALETPAQLTVAEAVPAQPDPPSGRRRDCETGRPCRTAPGRQRQTKQRSQCRGRSSSGHLTKQSVEQRTTESQRHGAQRSLGDRRYRTSCLARAPRSQSGACAMRSST